MKAFLAIALMAIATIAGSAASGTLPPIDSRNLEEATKN
jgi:hypothetical protein